MKTVITSLIILCSGLLHAQQFGGHPFSTRWRQINTDTVQVIFPQGQDSVAKGIATLVQALAANRQITLGNRVRKAPIVLQPETVVSNGYVGLGPFRSEFYLTPPSDNFEQGSVPWAEKLALHEYRHIQQFNNFYNGLSKFAYNILGQEAYSLAINAAVPNWFFEGDAVYQETVLSPQGRGRMPYFLKAFPALWQGNKNYRYMKLRNGSYKDYVPNHYDLGYLLVNYGYKQYGPGFWKNVTKDASAYRNVFYPMQSAIKRHTGKSYPSFVNDAFNYYKKIYDTLHLRKDISLTVVPENKKTVTNYYFPHQIGQDSLLYLKSSYQQRPAFYIKDKSGEHLLRIRDISIENQFSYKDGKIVYAAYETNPRRSWVTYSVIKIYDLKTGVSRSLTHKTRYFSPDISHNGNAVVANSITPEGKASLVIIDTKTGKVRQSISKDSILYFSNPKFTEYGNIITAVRTVDSKMALATANPLNGQVTYLTPSSFTIIGQLSYTQGKVYFTASQGLKDEIFCFDIIQKTLKKLETNELTQYQVNNAYGKLSWTSFTADGFRLRQTDVTATRWANVDTEQFTHSVDGIVAAPIENILPTLPKENFKIEQYKKLTNPINLHSWYPNYENPIYSITAFGNNILNTVETQLSYTYNENDRTHSGGGSLVYGGLPVNISLSSYYTGNRKTVIKNQRKKWNELANSVSLNLPLNWVHNRVYRFANFGTTYTLQNNIPVGWNKDKSLNAQFGYITHFAGYGQQVQRAAQDIFPRWGYNFNMQYRYALSKYDGKQISANLTGYLPGFFPAHHLVATISTQVKGGRDNIYANSVAFARGHAAVNRGKVVGTALNYHFPLVYPDWGMGNIVYINRLRGNLFLDNTFIKENKPHDYTRYSSIGGEIYADTQWWNQHPLTFGIRAGYLLKSPVATNKKHFFEFILPVSILPK
ncbi:MAG: hypothetical protein QM727_13245 [Niabella sp.]